MPQALNQIDYGSDQNGLNAIRAGLVDSQLLDNLTNERRNSLARQQSGAARAAGDNTGAINYLAGAGLHDEANTLQEFQNKQDALASSKKALGAWADGDPNAALSSMAQTGNWDAFGSLLKAQADKRDQALKLAQQSHEKLYKLTADATVPGDIVQTEKNFWQGIAAAKTLNIDTSKEEAIARQQGVPTALNAMKAQLGDAFSAMQVTEQNQKKQQESYDKFSRGLALFKDRPLDDEGRRNFVNMYLQTGEIPGLEHAIDKDGNLIPGADKVWISRGDAAKQLLNNEGKGGGGRLSAVEGAWKVAQEQAEKTGEDPYEIFKKNTGVAYRDAMADIARDRVDNTDSYNRARVQQQGIRDQNIANGAAARLNQKGQENDKKAIGETAIRYKDDLDGWVNEGVRALEAQGYNVKGLNTQAGLNVALGMGGLGAKSVGLDQGDQKIEQGNRKLNQGDAALQLKQQHEAAWSANADKKIDIDSRHQDIRERMADIADRRATIAEQVAQIRKDGGTPLIKNATFIKAAAEEANNGVTVPLDLAAKVAEDPKHRDIQIQTNPDGTKTAVLVQVNNPGGATYAAAKQIQEERIKHNSEHPDDPMPTDFESIFSQTSKADIAKQRLGVSQGNLEARKTQLGISRQNANTREKNVDFQTSPGQPGSLAYSRTPEGAEAITYGRESAKSNAKLDTTNNRIDSFHEQAGNIIKYVTAPENRPLAEKAVGWLSTRIGREYWDTGKGKNVPEFISNLRADTSFLKDELAQYLQTKGGQSDVRAKQMWESLGDIQSSPNLETFVERLVHTDGMMQAWKHIKRLDAAKPHAAATENAPLQNPLRQPPQNALAPTQPTPGRYKYDPATGDFQ